MILKCALLGLTYSEEHLILVFNIVASCFLFQVYLCLFIFVCFLCFIELTFWGALLHINICLIFSPFKDSVKTNKQTKPKQTKTNRNSTRLKSDGVFSSEWIF